MPSTHAEIRLSEPGMVLDALLEHLSHHDVEVEREAGGVRAAMNAGEARIALRPDALLMDASAPSDEALDQVAAFLASHVREFAHPETPTIRWSGLSGFRLLPDFREMTVTRVLDLGPHMRRLTLTGQDLARFDSPGDLHVRLFFAKPGGAPAWPKRGADGLIAPVNPATKPDVRKYTIRRIDLQASEVDIDFVLHADAGPGSAFAERAKPGDLIGMAGPGGRTAAPADWMLLVGDETALPAIARILESLPASTKGEVVIETDSQADRIAISAPEGVRVRWLQRREGAPSLRDAVREIPVPATGSRFCWAGAEFEDIQAIRQHWRETCGLAKDEQLAVAYWRRGEEGP